MDLLVFFFVILFTTVLADYISEIKETEGHCNLIEGIQVSKDKSKYEGRWYTVYTGLVQSKENHITCFAFDTFFDQYGQYHNFIQPQKNGTVMDIVGMPLDEEKGIYELHFDGAKPNIVMVSTLFYIDDEINFWWKEECIRNENTKRMMASVGVRRLEDFDKNKQKIDELYKKLEAKGGITDKFRLPHEDCQYPDKMQNPFGKESE